MLSQTSDYALRAMLVLARRHGAGPDRIEEIDAARAKYDEQVPGFTPVD